MYYQLAIADTVSLFHCERRLYCNNWINEIKETKEIENASKNNSAVLDAISKAKQEERRKSEKWMGSVKTDSKTTITIHYNIAT